MYNRREPRERKEPEIPAAEAENFEAYEEKPVVAKIKEKIPEGSLKEELSDFKSDEAVDIIVRLSNAGTSKSEIGLILRDQYGIPSIRDLTNKTLTEILHAKKITEEIPEDIMNLIRKSVKLLDHMNKNKHDYSAKRGYQLTVAKINRLATYYRSKKTLPADWRYTEERARLLVK